ncbi:hypothetical protein HDU85_003674 [Gaertneriomyces sp. JEL0708]|nr:hypothetical protein HDU85_003674 [Gaertneriomyces sp. JEL0708]
MLKAGFAYGGMAGVSTPNSSTRVLSPPGGASSISLFDDAPLTPTRASVKRAAPPGGKSSFSFQDDALLVTSPSIKVLKPVGGGSTLTLDGSGKVPITSSIKTVAPPGGTSTVSLDGAGSSAVAASIKVMHPTGGRTSLSLDGSGQPHTPRSIKVLTSPGGSSTLDLAGGGSIPHSTRIRTRYTPGGPSSFSFTDSGEPVSPPPSIKLRAPPGGETHIHLFSDDADEEPEPIPSFSGMRVFKHPPGTNHSDEGDEDVDDIAAGIKSVAVHEHHSRRPSWKSPSPTSCDSEDMPEGALRAQDALPPVQRSQIVIADDKPAEPVFAPRRQGPGRRAIQNPGGNSSISFY